MISSISLSSIDDGIALIRDYIRQLIEQAAAGYSGAQDEERSSRRSARQTEGAER